MKEYVLDCSMTLGWCFEDEKTEKSESLLDEMESGVTMVPALWYFEVANTLVVAERRGRINRAAAAAFLDLLCALPIVVDPESATHAWAGVITLAREHQLSAYDAAYLELALRRGSTLATRDQRLASAAETLGVAVLY